MVQALLFLPLEQPTLKRKASGSLPLCKGLWIPEGDLEFSSGFTKPVRNFQKAMTVPNTFQHWQPPHMPPNVSPNCTEKNLHACPLPQNSNPIEAIPGEL